MNHVKYGALIVALKDKGWQQNHELLYFYHLDWPCRRLRFDLVSLSIEQRFPMKMRRNGRWETRISFDVPENIGGFQSIVSRISEIVSGLTILQSPWTTGNRARYAKWHT